ncbi:MAG TPA: transposase [Pyrinomonadaceae bacterium]|nr:transposase [Pyrinomonadaceae bacterium]
MCKPTIQFEDKQVQSENDPEKRRINSVLAVIAMLAKYAETQEIVVASAAPQSYGVDLNCQRDPAEEGMAYINEKEAVEPEKPKPKRLRPTRWSEYNLAQTREKSHFLALLYELCQTIEEPEQTMGRPRIPLKDIIFSSTLKTYTGFSTRRLTCDLKEVQRNGYIEKAPHFNSIYGYMEMQSLTQPLMQLINISSLPLASVETTFAVDSSGLSTSQYDQWVKHRYGRPKPVEKQKWLKVHIICGTRTHIITGVRVTNGNAGDSPEFISLVEETARNFLIDEVSADKAYSAEKNMEAVLQKGGVPYIAFRSNATSTNRRSGEIWKRLYHFYAYNHQHFMEHYHKRSNVESTFSTIKAKFGGSLRSKTERAQINEALFKVLAHNICVVIHSIYELGIEPTFWEEPTFCENSASSQKVV